MGANVKRIRQDRGLSQTALAEAMAGRGHSAWRQTTVSRTEQGARALLFAEMGDLAEILGAGVMRDTSVSRSMDGKTRSEIREAIDAKLVAVSDELGELRRLVGLYDQLMRPIEHEPLESERTELERMLAGEGKGEDQ